MKTTMISGVTGMDGSHMVDFLLENTPHKIIGLVRRLSVKNWKNIEHNLNNPRFNTVEVDITDSVNINSVISDNKPDYFIHFAAASFVGNSWTQPENHIQTNSLSLLYILESVRKYSPHTRVYQASSSEMFGDVLEVPQSENTPFNPSSVYGVSKATAHFLLDVYRKSYGIYCVGGILFNHESSSGRRGIEFVTRHITSNVARIFKSISRSETFEPLLIGQINSRRDWSAAEDFCDGIWRMLNQEIYNKELKKICENIPPENLTKFLSNQIKHYVMSSDETHTVREFIELAFKAIGIDGFWNGDGTNEKFFVNNYLAEELPHLGINPLVIIDKNRFRPNDVKLLIGNSKLIRDELGWKPTIKFSDLVKKMVNADLALTFS